MIQLGVLLIVVAVLMFALGFVMGAARATLQATTRALARDRALLAQIERDELEAQRRALFPTRPPVDGGP